MKLIYGMPLIKKRYKVANRIIILTAVTSSKMNTAVKFKFWLFLIKKQLNFSTIKILTI